MIPNPGNPTPFMGGEWAMGNGNSSQGIKGVTTADLV